MKPILEHLPVEPGETFLVREFVYPYFPRPYHYHPEFELVYIEQSYGQRLVANHLDEFKPGSLSLLGSNLPHVYRNHRSYYEPDCPDQARSIVVHFLPASLGEGTLRLPQLQAVRQLLDHAMLGIDISGPVCEQVVANMRQMLTMRGFDRLMLLLKTLDLIARSPADCHTITQPTRTGIAVQPSERLAAIFDYLVKNLHNPITLDEMAQMVGMSRTSLCRYFRDQTGRTLWTYISELRLRYAAQQLRDTTNPIVYICHNSGFDNLSNFNRMFRRLYNCTPSQYRKSPVEPAVS